MREKSQVFMSKAGSPRPFDIWERVHFATFLASAVEG
jgi:hypothetical protein